MRSGERTVLRPVLFVASAAHPMKSAAVAAVVSGKGAALAVERQRPRVATAFGEELEPIRLRVVAPDRLSEKRDASDLCRTGASVDAVEPTVGSPRQAVGERVRVLEPEAFEPYLGLAVWQPVSGCIAIEEQVRRVHHPDAAAPRQHAGGDVQAGDDVLVGLEPPVAIRVLEHGDFVRTADVVRWR